MMKRFWVVTGLLLRGRQQWLQAGAVGLLIASIVGLLVGLNSLKLSPAQEADMLLGTYSHRVDDVAPLGSELDGATAPRLKQNVLDAGASAVGVQIMSMTVWPDQLPITFSDGPVKVVAYYEDTGVSQANRLPGSHTLTTGVAPSAAGEVALSSSLAAELGHPSHISVFGGAVTLTVTGTVEPLYGSQSWRIIAAEGTWATFPSQQIHSGYPSTSGNLTVLWNGPAEVDAVLGAVAHSNPATAGTQSLLTGHLSRDQLLHGNDAVFTAAERTYLVPALALVTLASVIAANLGRRRAMNVRHCLEGVGMSPVQVLPPLLSALAVTLSVGAIAGLLAGQALGWLVRALVLPGLADHPLSPASAMLGSAAALTAVAVGTGLLSALVRFRRPSTHASPAREAIAHTIKRIPWAWVRRAAACILASWSLPSLLNASTIQAASTASILFTTGLILLIPDLLRILTMALSTKRVTTLSARRMLEADPARHTLAATALAAAIALPAVFGTLYATSFRLEEDRNQASIPPGQIWVSAAELGSPELVQRTVTELEDVDGLGDPIHIDSPDVYLSQSNSHGATGLWSIRTPEDLYSVLGSEPIDAATAMLNSGGIVVWDKAGGDLIKITADGTEEPTSITGIISLDDLGINIDPSIQMALAGAMLTSTAESIGAPVTPNWTAIYVDVPEAAQTQASNHAISAGITPKAVAYTTPPQPLTFPPRWHIAMIGVAAALFVMVWAVFSSQATHLRAYATRMLAIGLDETWSLRVLTHQALLTVIAGLLGGLLAGVLAVALFSRYAADGALTLEIPWTYLTPVTAATLMVTVLASLLSFSHLRPRYPVEDL